MESVAVADGLLRVRRETRFAVHQLSTYASPLARTTRFAIGALLLSVTVVGCVIEFWLNLVQIDPSSSTALNIVLAAMVVLPPLVFSAVGLIVVSHGRRNRTGWAMCAIGAAFATGFVFTDLPPYLYSHHHHSHDALMVTLALIGTYVWSPFLVSLVWLLLIFPTGHMVSPSWSRAFPWGIGFCVVADALALVTPGPLAFAQIHNPITVSLLPSFLGVGATLADALLVIMGAAGLMYRFRRSRGEERQQLKWFTYSAGLTCVLLCTAFTTASGVAMVFTFCYFLAITMVPVSIAIAITKYRLWDIDALINRTLVYGMATVSLVAVYGTNVVVFQSLLRRVSGQRSDLVIAVSTLLIAALFNPWRGRLQAFIDRRFYRRRYNAVRTLADLSNALRDDVDLDHVHATLLTVLGTTMEPQHVSFWMPTSAEHDGT